MKIRRVKKFYLLFLLLSFFFLPDTSGQTSEDQNLPEWLKRVELSIKAETDKKPTFYFQTVQPLYQDGDQINTIFIQPRLSLRDERGMYNLGMGYRKLVSENLVVGINVFGDYQELHRHGRLGVGLEALGQVLEARINTYFGDITNKKTVSVMGSSTTIERVADGGDFEIGSQVPFLPWLKVYGSGFWFDFKDFSDARGWKSRTEAKLNPYLKLEFFTWDDNKGDREYGGQVRMNFAFYSVGEIFNSVKFADEPFPKKDLRQILLLPVERQFDIIIEKKIKSNGFVVEAGRS